MLLVQLSSLLIPLGGIREPITLLTKDAFSMPAILSDTSGVYNSQFFSATKPDCAFEETLFPSLYSAVAIDVTT